MYCFRLRFFLTGPQIGISASEVALAGPPEDAESVVLRAHGLTPPPIESTSHLVVEGREYPAAGDALDSGQRWRGILERAFAASNIGADFGDWGGPSSVITAAGVAAWEKELGQRVANDEHGLMAFECEPRPRFISGSASLTVLRSGDALLTRIGDARAAAAPFSAQERVAYELFSASFALSAADARFVMLMMAVETLIDVAAREAPVRAHVESLIARTQSADIPHREKKSIVQSLQGLTNESISQGGRKLAATLGDRSYGGQTPQKFFTGCYALR